MRPAALFTRARTLLLACLVLASFNGAAQDIGVVYPDTDPPYKAVFDAIRDGITKRLGPLSPKALRMSDDQASRASLRDWLARTEPEVVITLGQVSTDAYMDTDYLAPQVIGALNASPQARPTASGISLIPDPARLFATLRELVPRAKRVWVVYDPGRDRWIIDLAQKAARAVGMTLLLREATDQRTAAQGFVELLNAANAGSDALWLLGNTNLLSTRDTLPYIVEQSWRRRMPVFSNTLLHAQRGVLFALYPDSERLGEALAEIAIRIARGGPQPPLQPLATVKRALNLRIADHLGLSISRPKQREFDLLFPQR